MAESDPKFLPYGKQYLHPDDINAVLDVLRSDYWTTGPVVAEFEKDFATYCGVTDAIAVANGTAGLHLAAMALDLGPSSLVVVPDITFVATANGARYVGADVLLCDVDPETGLMTAETLAQCLASTEREIDCVIPMHLAGQTIDMAPLLQVCTQSKNAKSACFIEDACHAVGATAASGNKIGYTSDSEMAIFSFHPVKTIAAGEGGMITTNDKHLADKLRYLRSHGITRQSDLFVNRDQAFSPSSEVNPWYYESQDLGFNYRLSDIHSALGRSQLKRLDEVKCQRTRLVNVYDEKFAAAGNNNIKPLGRLAGCDPCWHLYVVLIDFASIGLSRQEVMDQLRERGIGTQVHYIPLHIQPSFQKGATSSALLPESLAGADQYYSKCLSLSLYHEMSDEDVDRVVSSLLDVIEQPTETE